MPILASEYVATITADFEAFGKAAEQVGIAFSRLDHLIWYSQHKKGIEML